MNPLSDLGNRLMAIPQIIISTVPQVINNIEIGLVLGVIEFLAQMALSALPRMGRGPLGQVWTMWIRGLLDLAKFKAFEMATQTITPFSLV